MDSGEGRGGCVLGWEQGLAGEVTGRMVGLGREVEVEVDRMVGGSAVPVLGLVVRDVVHSTTSLHRG